MIITNDLVPFLSCMHPVSTVGFLLEKQDFSAMHVKLSLRVHVHDKDFTEGKYLVWHQSSGIPSLQRKQPYREPRYVVLRPGNKGLCPRSIFF